MKAKEYLSFLQRIGNLFDALENSSDIDKGLLDDIIYFCKIDDNKVYEDLLEKQNLPILLSEFQKLISNINNRINICTTLIDGFSPNNFLNNILIPYESRIEFAQKKLRPYLKKKDLLNSRLESWCMKYSDTSREIINLKKDLEFASKECTTYKQKLDIAQAERNEIFKNNSYFLSFSFNPFLEKMSIIEKWILRLSNSNSFSQIIFKDEDSIELAYSILIKMSLLKTVSLPEFYNQITLNKALTLEKNPSKDKYIAYSINKLKAFIVDTKKDIWEKVIVKYFQIQNYDKIKTVNQDHLKTKDHDKIDFKISNYFESLKS